jgi:hypothetical protein
MEGAGNVIFQKRAAMHPFWLLFFFFLMIDGCKPKPRQMETRLSVKGFLKDAAGKPIANATVMIADGSYEFNDMASVTNDSGEFRLSNIVVPGNYTLQIEANNQSKKKQVNLTGGDVITVHF